MTLKNMNSKLISIIVPVYNCEEYLSECIESILKQSYKHFELLLLNDGSSDKSEKICLKYQEQDYRVKVVSHENMGVALTRKKGLDISKGEYVAFIDADDTIESNYLETLYNKIIEKDIDVVCCNSIDSGIKNMSIAEKSVIYGLESWLEAFFRNKRYAYCIWGKLYKKQVLENIEFPNMKYGEDTLVVLNVFKTCNKVKLLPYAGYNYRDNPNGAMNKVSSIQQQKDLFTLSKYIFKLCEKDYVEFYDIATQRIIQTIFNVIMEGSCINKKEWIDFKVEIDECIKEIDFKYYFYSIKGIIVYIYSILPKAVFFSLKKYREIKYKKYI